MIQEHGKKTLKVIMTLNQKDQKLLHLISAFLELIMHMVYLNTPTLLLSETPMNLNPTGCTIWMFLNMSWMKECRCMELYQYFMLMGKQKKFNRHNFFLCSDHGGGISLRLKQIFILTSC